MNLDQELAFARLSVKRQNYLAKMGKVMRERFYVLAESGANTRFPGKWQNISHFAIITE